jgi:flagellar basal body rod protein FlgG
MKIGAINLFNLASGRMQWLSERQKVISENVANADTAEYRAREVEDFGSYLQRSQVAGLQVSAQVVAVGAGFDGKQCCVGGANVGGIWRIKPVQNRG